MPNKSKISFLIPLLIFITIAVFLAVGLSLNPRHLPSTLIGKIAPSFTLDQLYRADKKISPSDYLGQRWILNVWASWCVGCRVEHPILNQLAKSTDILIVGLNYKDDPNTAQKWLAERGNPYDVIAKDITGDAGIDWGVYGAPETFVIDENGLVIYKHIGPLDVNVVQQELLPLFSSAQSPANSSQ